MTDREFEPGESSRRMIAARRSRADRCGGSLRALACVALWCALLGAAHAQSGRPDLSGVWTNDPEPETRAYQNDTFAPDLPRFTDWGRERYEAARPSRGPRGVSVTETDDPVYACFPPGMPRIYLHPFPVEIIQTAERVLMIFEYDHFVRQIYTDGRGHRADLAPTWMGDSIGEWVGGTLVVESLNFNGATWLDRTGVPHSESLRVIERIRLVDEDRLEIDITMEDPVAFAEPWHGVRHLRRTDWTIEEFSCMDNANFLEYEQQILDFDAAQ